MSYLILLLILFIILLFVYNRFNKDILSPSFISCCMFLFSAFLAFVGILYWNNIKNISFQTILIIVIGIICFVIGEYFARKKTILNANNDEKEEIKPIQIEKWKLILTVIGIIITAIFYFLEIKRICLHFGFDSNNLPQLLAFYRTKTSLFSTELINNSIDINFIVRQMKKLCDVVCIIFMYIVANNLIAKDKLKNIMIYSIPVILTLLVSLLSSGRSTMMHMIVGFVMMFLLIFRYKNKRFSKKNIFFIAVTLIIVLLSFYLIVPLLGRGTDKNIVSYISFYLGSPIPSFNHSNYY